MPIVADWSKYPNFKKSEFDCKCGCGFNNATDELLIKLQEARTLARVPIIISSGCRCKSHNAKVGGVDDSSHEKGNGADIETADSQTRFAIVSALLRVGFVRVGVAHSFTHVDCDPKKPKNLCWVY